MKVTCFGEKLSGVLLSGVLLNDTTALSQNTKRPVHQGCHTARVNSPVQSIQDLVNKLCVAGVKTKLRGSVSQPFFAIRGRILAISGPEVQVFEFKTRGRAEAAAKQIGPDGSPIGTTMITWVAPPHFFKSGRLIALYLGNDLNVIGPLENTLGKQFAGK